jgi:Ca-activated chloride channel family protein
MAAVDDLTMVVGERVVVGKIKRREEARAIYEAARNRGQVAGLLDQERPNVFTQHVANILPGNKVKITIHYVETLRYEGGSYEFVFPLVVGPRYIPAHLPDASRITPPVTPPGTRAGHDISIEVALDAGVPIDALQCPTHASIVERPNAHQARVRLQDQAVIPNKDFILRCDVLGRQIQDAVLAHRAARGGFFTLLLSGKTRNCPICARCRIRSCSIGAGRSPGTWATG